MRSLFCGLRYAAAVIVGLTVAATIAAQTSSFTYQGRLQDGGAPANGSYDLQFRLLDAAASGNQVGNALVREDVLVTNGTFTVTLDFGAAAFPGADRFLEISVRPGASTGPFTILNPVQQIASTPYSVRSGSAGFADTAATATNATQLAGVSANQYVITSDSRLSDSRAPLAGFPSYIQNTTTQQASSNFNVSGNGTAGGTLSGTIVSAATQFNFGGNRVLSASGNNLFLGVNAGAGNTTGFNNSFIGLGAGRNNTSGPNNTFVGAGAGSNNLTGGANSFFGFDSGGSNTNGGSNSFFGYFAGSAVTEGAQNSFFGQGAGGNTSTGGNNSFFGNTTGISNTAEFLNSLFGSFADTAAGISNATAIGARAKVTQSNSLVLGSIAGINGAGFNSNVGIGTTAPTSRLHVVGDTNLVGNLTVSGNLNATLPSGSQNYIQNSTSQQANSNFNISGNGIVAGTLSATTVSSSGLNVTAAGLFDSVFSNSASIGNRGLLIAPFATLDVIPPSGKDILFGGGSATGSEIKLTNSGTAHFSIYNSGNSKLTFAQTSSVIDTNTAGTPLMVITASGNVGIGTTSPAVKLEVRSGFDGQSAPQEAVRIDGPNTPADANSAQDIKWSFASAGSAGVRSYRGSSWDTYLQFYTNSAGQGSDSPQVRMHLDHAGNLGIGTTSPLAKLHVNGVIRMDALGSQAGIFPLCWNASDQIASCSTSSLRYKADVESFNGGLQVIERLRPIAFTWREGGMRDIGLAAEEVEKVEPRLTYRNKKGQVDGVRYNQLSTLFINAFKEQQAQIKQQQDELNRQREKIKQQDKLAREQQEQLDHLKALVCRSHRRADVCR